MAELQSRHHMIKRGSETNRQLRVGTCPPDLVKTNVMSVQTHPADEDRAYQNVRLVNAIVTSQRLGKEGLFRALCNEISCSPYLNRHAAQLCLAKSMLQAAHDLVKTGMIKYNITTQIYKSLVWSFWRGEKIWREAKQCCFGLLNIGCGRVVSSWKRRTVTLCIQPDLS